MKKIVLTVAGFFLVAVIITAIVFIPPMLGFSRHETITIDDNLTIVLGYGGNSAILLSDDGGTVMIVDPKMGGGSKIVKKIVDTSSAPGAKLVVVDTHFHTDHMGGNEIFPGARIIAGDYTRDQWAGETGDSAYPDETVKAGDEITVLVGDETVKIRNMGQAHTWNDMIVYFSNRKMLLTGDLVFNRSHPALIKRCGTNVTMWLAALDYIMNNYDIKTLVPGHGSPSDRKAVADMKEYFTSIRSALDNKSRLNELEVKYRDYFAFPFLMGFRRTVSFLKNETQP